jgi:hypothetical protein
LREDAMTESQAAATRFCARAIGPLMLIIGAVVIARGSDLALIVPAIIQDSPLAFVTGVFTLIVGMVLFAAHHHWSSPTAIVISLLAILTIVRGVILMFAPSIIAGFANAALAGAGAGIIVAGIVGFLIGAWLTYAGWFAKRPA